MEEQGAMRTGAVADGPQRVRHGELAQELVLQPASRQADAGVAGGEPWVEQNDRDAVLRRRARRRARRLRPLRVRAAHHQQAVAGGVRRARGRRRGAADARGARRPAQRANLEAAPRPPRRQHRGRAGVREQRARGRGRRQVERGAQLLHELATQLPRPLLVAGLRHDVAAGGVEELRHVQLNQQVALARRHRSRGARRGLDYGVVERIRQRVVVEGAGEGRRRRGGGGGCASGAGDAQAAAERA